MKKRRRGRKQKERFSAVLAVKENARTRVGQPPASRVLTEKRPAAEKYKPTWAEQLRHTEE